jgi:hypothetical protein
MALIATLVAAIPSPGAGFVLLDLTPPAMAVGGATGAVGAILVEIVDQLAGRPEAEAEGVRP